MIHDFYADNRFTTKDDIKDDIDAITAGTSRFQHLRGDVDTRLQILKLGTFDPSIRDWVRSGWEDTIWIKDPRTGRSKQKKQDHVAGHRRIIESRQYDAFIRNYQSVMAALGLWEPQIDLSFLPLGSFIIKFTFTLDKPFFSADDQAHSILDNTMKKERVFRVPMISGSMWKGQLHSIYRLQHTTRTMEDKEQERRIFGALKETGPEGTSAEGQLIIYPTYFDRLGLDIINPHDRMRRTGTIPITYEVVPEGAQGTFCALYATLYKADLHLAIQDASAIFDALYALLTLYGASAKHSTEYGIIQDRITQALFQMRSRGKPVELRLESASFKEFVHQLKQELAKLAAEGR